MKSTAKGERKAQTFALSIGKPSLLNIFSNGKKKLFLQRVAASQAGYDGAKARKHIGGGRLIQVKERGVAQGNQALHECLPINPFASH